MHEVRLAVCLPDVDRDAIAARLHGATVVSRGSESAVILTASSVSEAELSMAVGKSVLLLSDSGLTDDVVERLIHTARGTGTQLMIANPDRYLPSRQLIRKQLSGPLGAPGLVRIHRWEPNSPDPIADVGLPAPLVRDLDTVLWLTGRRPDRVFACEQLSDSGRYLQVHLGIPDGVMALLDFTDRLPLGDGYQALSVIAFSGAAYADDHRNSQLNFGGGQARAVQACERAGQIAAMAQEFVAVLRADGDLTTASSQEWRAVFSLAAAVRESLASGQAVAMEGC